MYGVIQVTFHFSTDFLLVEREIDAGSIEMEIDRIGLEEDKQILYTKYKIILIYYKKTELEKIIPFFKNHFFFLHIKYKIL